jgi:flagellar protein FliJ
MTMNDLQPLMALLAQAEKERDEAQAHAQRQLDALDAARAQAEQLVAYRREYEQRWGQRFASQGQIELVQCYQGFVVRLNQAVDHQARVQEQAVRQLERARAAVQQQELRVASVRKLIERRVQEIARRGEDREQRSLDELASRAAWNRLAAATTRF